MQINDMNQVFSHIDWVKFYGDYIYGEIKEGQNYQYSSRCPFHKGGQEKEPSFSFNGKTGLYKCFSCPAKGNGITFLEKYLNISSKDAVTMLKKRAGISNMIDKKCIGKPAFVPYSVAQYAEEKHLSPAFLENLGLADDRGFITIPYFYENSEPAQAIRKRYPTASGRRFGWKSGSKPMLYGLWLPENKAAERLILVEGESDTQSLLSHGIPSLGIPGANTFQESWVALLRNRTLYLHIEPEQSGITFKEHTTKQLLAAAYKGPIYLFSCVDIDQSCKDPSDLHIKYGDQFPAMIDKLLAGATPFDLFELQHERPIDDMPCYIQVPTEYRLDKDGVYYLNHRNGEYEQITHTPVIITRLVSAVSGIEEKVEIAFRRLNSWKTLLCLRSTLFNAPRMIALCDHGLGVSSENARNLVKYLMALEAANMKNLKTASSTSQLGWIDNYHFLPGLGGDYVLDVDNSLDIYVDAYHAKGDLDEWLAIMDDHRNKNTYFRFLLAASFAAPLLRILNVRSNLFVYIWGASQGGKTAGLLAALSAWGEPHALMQSFNGTKVGLERTAAFFKDLPLGIDERQMAGSKQESLDTLIYTLANGASKLRGAKAGGLQKIDTWRTIFLATGEEPLSDETSQTGVVSRSLQIHGLPFDSPEEAQMMYNCINKNYGTAGVAFVKKVLALDNSTVKQLSSDLMKAIGDIGKSRDNMASHYVAVAAIATADVLLSTLLYGMEMDASQNRALQMAEAILATLPKGADTDQGHFAVQFVKDLTFIADKSSIIAYGIQLIS